MIDLLDRLRLEHPIVQAGMGGGISRGDLAGAVSAAGALGTIGIMPPDRLAQEIVRARELAPGRPIAVNLLLPFTRPAHVRACVDARVDAVALFFGSVPDIVRELRDAGILVMQQVGTPEEARHALADGVDVLIAQGIEAGGHLKAVRPLDEALPAILEAAAEAPVIAAGGVADAARVRELRTAGAAAVAAGTRFLLTEECHAHPAYQRRVVGAEHTVETELFGLGWPARHRVVPNAATRRWTTDGATRRPLLALNRRTGGIGGLLPLAAMEPLAKVAHARVPLLSPAPALRGMPERTIEATPLYAGMGARAMDGVLPAAEAVRLLAG